MSWYGLDSASQAFWPEVRSATQTAAQNFSSEHPMFRRLSFPASSSCSNNLDGMNSPTPPQPYTVTTRSPRPCPKRSKVPRTGTLFPLFLSPPAATPFNFPSPHPCHCAALLIPATLHLQWPRRTTRSIYTWTTRRNALEKQHGAERLDFRLCRMQSKQKHQPYSALRGSCSVSNTQLPRCAPVHMCAQHMSRIFVGEARVVSVEAHARSF